MKIDIRLIAVTSVYHQERDLLKVFTDGTVAGLPKAIGYRYIYESYNFQKIKLVGLWTHEYVWRGSESVGKRSLDDFERNVKSWPKAV